VKLTGASMTFSVDLFFSFRSPYSYLALPRTMKMVADYDVTVNLRPVYPLAVRVPGFFKRANPQFARYVVLDAIRVAKHEDEVRPWALIAVAIAGITTIAGVVLVRRGRVPFG